MSEENGTKQDEKPFSVLDKFRQLKKDKEQAGPITTAVEESSNKTEAPDTVFQTSASPSTEDFGSRGGFRGRGFGRFGRQRRKRNNDNSNERPPKRVAVEWRGQKESDVGITEFIRSGGGFDVLIKHRYTDFHVHEIDTDGNVVKFTSMEFPKPEEEEPVEAQSSEELLDVFSAEQWATLKEIVENKSSATMKKDVTDLNKEERQKIHKAIKIKFGVHVYSNTNLEGGRKIMEIGYGVGRISMKPRWPDNRPEYLHFVVHKENCETTEAINTISRFVQVKPNKFGYAGTKDKRAVTTQQMCLRRTEATRFEHCRSLRNIYVGNFCYKWENLRLGDLSGNRFKLALRNVKASDEMIKDAVESLKENGFINYFGMQRFGQSALVPTHAVGQAILKGDWKLATELILKPRPGEGSYNDIKEAREVWWETRNAADALKCLGRKEKSIEGKILSGLKKHGPNAYQNAFDGLPHYTVTLYLHSYQSLIWNKVVSRRMRQFGLKVLPGDLVRTGAGADKDLDTQAYRWQDNRDSDTSDDDDDSQDGCKTQVRVLTAEEAETASIYDVVYPLPGDDIRFPDNEITQWYHEMLEADGHSIASFSRVNRKYGMYGAYRRMVEKVDGLEWYIQRYSDPEEDLLQPDIDIYNRKPPLVLNPDGEYRAIIIEFNLKTCCYATMAIRELAKCDTSPGGQTVMTNRAREEDLALKKLKQEENEKMEEQSGEKSEEILSSTDNNDDLSGNETQLSNQTVEEVTEDQLQDVATKE